MDQTTPTLSKTARSMPIESPRRLTLVAMASAVAAIFVAMVATGSDLSHDAELADIVGAYDQSKSAMQIGSYAGMVLVGLLLFFGAALRNAIRAGGRSWLADVAFLGLAAVAATVASWVVTDLAMWKAVDYGDESTIRTIATISDAGFLPLMAAMIATYIGTGLAGLRTGSLPKWLAITSIVVGVLAPLGPLGFIGTMLLPLFILATAVTVRLDPAA